LQVGDEVQQIWCYYCKSPVFSERSRHCMRCNRCVSNFDHHCKFVNNCVGKKNYKIFIKVIITLQIFQIFLLSCTAYNLKIKEEFEYLDLLSYALIIVSTAIIIPNGYLIGFHIFIHFKGISTFEYIEMNMKLSASITPNLAENDNK